MWPIIQSINLIRYLFVWRINRSLIWAPRSLSPEISQVLGNLIAERLPAADARLWRKSLATWAQEQGSGPKHFPETPWPLESVLFTYPSKRSFTQGELFLWELKLLGESADHGLFLEVILPAIEEAATSTKLRGQHKHDLWGGFGVHALYVARGPHWEPIVEDGRLDLGYRVTPSQWAEGLAFQPKSQQVLEQLRWLTPFDLAPSSPPKAPPKKIPPQEIPSLGTLLEALVERMARLLPGKHNTPADVWASLDQEERSRLQEALHVARNISLRKHRLQRSPLQEPGRWIGEQTFQFIPPSLLPYLQLASILHLGHHAHFGCGTFTLV